MNGQGSISAHTSAALFLLWGVPSSVLAQTAGESAATSAPLMPTALTQQSYTRPPKEIEDLVRAPWYRNVSLNTLSPDGKTFLITLSTGPTSLSDLSRFYYNLAGEKIDPKGNRDRAQNLRGASGYQLFDPQTQTKRDLKTPPNCKLSSAAFSPDGSKLAFMAHSDSETTLWVADVKSGISAQLSSRPLLATAVTSLQWVDQGRKLVSVLIPSGRGPAPKNGSVPAQPRVRLTDPSSNRIPTLRGLLQTQLDEDLLEYYETGQLAVLDLASKSVQEIGKPAMIQSVDASPDGKFFRVRKTERPFSYEVLASSFPDREEIWDATGKVLAELSKRALRVGSPPPSPTPAPTTAAPTGPRGPGGGRGQRGAGGGSAGGDDKRSIAWRPDGAGLSFLQLADAPVRVEPGQGETQAQNPPARRKDRVMLWVAPFGKDDIKAVYESEQAIGSVLFSADCQTLFLTETVTGSETLFAVNLKEPGKRMVVYTYRTGGDNPASPGSLMMLDNENGRSAVRVSKLGQVFLSGVQTPEDPAKDAPRPFLDVVNLSDSKNIRIWQSAADTYDTLLAILDDSGSTLTISRQSPKMVPNAYLWSQAAPEAPKKLTENVDYAPKITQARRERIQVTRPDGFKFWVSVTLPTYHVDGVAHPAFFWFYPSEFTDQRAYDRGQRNRNKNQFKTLSASTKDYLIALGFTLVEPDCPIVGPQGRMNDSFISDLRANLWATIDALDKKRYIDRDRLAIGGHSYGAFGTAHALIHTPYFKAGIAGDGNYNRTLTPAGFQAEPRNLWEGRDTYLDMSPILRAEEMTGALLMYHGLDDQNMGTDPINSERLFHALENLGKTAALYMYPYEDHGPAAIETHLDLWARWVAWLEKYVKGSGK
jgi:dipeptidyl aminopeptidase/acylaminoacyl peptidase